MHQSSARFFTLPLPRGDHQGEVAEEKTAGVRWADQQQVRPWAGWLQCFRSDSNNNILIHMAREQGGAGLRVNNPDRAAR